MSRLKTQQQFLKSTNFGNAFEKKAKRPAPAEKAGQSKTSPARVGREKCQSSSKENEGIFGSPKESRVKFGPVFQRVKRR
jgi:hypothetical protein